MPLSPTSPGSDTASRLLARARTLFLKRNYADVTMDQVVAAAEVTKGALYHHFKSKEELYLALLHQDLAEKQELFEQAAASTGSCRERLRRLTQSFLELPREKRDLIMLVRRDVNVFDEPVRSELVRAYQAALPAQVERILRDGIRDGELAGADPRLLSWDFVALVEVSLSPYAESVHPRDEAKLDHVLNLFFRGASATPGDHRT